ncbi:MAG: LysR family transcriptional regulator [Myxococcota bacterium]
MDRWDEMRTAYMVARLGTLSAAATELGIHRATVVRHIDALEKELGGKLFQRHARGYTPTEAGQDLLRVAQATAEQFEQLAGRTRGRVAEVSGELVLTSVEVVAPLIIPALQAFHASYPQTRIRYDISGRLYRLEYGEAHVAIRAGEMPDQPDNVVRPFFTLRSGLYAHRRYIAQHGRPVSPEDFKKHAYIQDNRTPMAGWGDALFEPDRVVFSSSNERITFQALKAGFGIGFYPILLAKAQPDLVQVVEPDPAWDMPFWLVTHIDLNWTRKVQAIVHHLLASDLPL